MLKKLSFLLFILLHTSLYGQGISVDKKNSYIDFVKMLENSKDLRFVEIIEKYDSYINRFPNDVNVKIYKCKFIGNAYYDDYEDYNLKYEETEACINTLYSDYPNHPKVLIYKIENTYGEERESLLDKVLDLFETSDEKWTEEDQIKLFTFCANFHEEDDDFRSISYANKAEKISDTIDLSLLKTRAHLRLNNREQARNSILSKLHNDSVDTWILVEKAKLLLELNQEDEALVLFNKAKEKDSTYSNNKGLYKIFLRAENYDIARTYLVSDTIPDYNKTESLQNLLKHDLSYSNPDTALLTYRRLQQESYYDDFLGIKRLRLFFKSPFKPWSFTDLSHILVLVLFFIVLFFIPYLWVLPVYGSSKYFKHKWLKPETNSKTNWTLKHFWLISFLYLCAQSILVIVFYYQNYINYYFDLVYSYVNDYVIESDMNIANAMLFFSGILLLFTLLLVNKKRFRFICSTNMSFIQAIGMSILFVVFNGILLKFLGNFIDLSEGASFINALSAKEDISALLNEYGFIMAVIVAALIAPFYEEVIFRGIILTSVEKHLGFKLANVIQALLFATIHFNLNLFIFYFSFAIITGYFVKRTGGLLTGITFHAVNNFLVVVSLYYISRLVVQ